MKAEMFPQLALYVFPIHSRHKPNVILTAVGATPVSSYPVKPFNTAPMSFAHLLLFPADAKSGPSHDSNNHINVNRPAKRCPSFGGQRVGDNQPLIPLVHPSRHLHLHWHQMPKTLPPRTV